MHDNYYIETSDDIEEYQEQITDEQYCSLCLFDIIPLFSYSTDYETTTCKILGLPVWKKREIRNEENTQFKIKTRYYLLGLPIFEIESTYTDSDEFDAEDLPD